MSIADLVKILGGLVLVAAGFTVGVPVGLVVLGVVLLVAGWLLED